MISHKIDDIDLDANGLFNVKKTFWKGSFSFKHFGKMDFIVNEFRKTRIQIIFNSWSIFSQIEWIDWWNEWF